MLTRPDDLVRFAELAAPGARETYGRGSNPPRELVDAMRPLVDARVLIPVRKREGADFLFLVQRGSAPFSGPVRRGRGDAGSRGVVRRKMVQRSSLSMMMAVLRDCAVRKAPCPSNEELARRCRLSGKAAASYRLRLLVQRGRIAIEDRGPMRARQVTILTGRHAGKSTGEG